MPLDSVHQVERELRAAGVPSPRVDAEILVADVLGLSRSEVYASRRQPTERELRRLRSLVDRRVARENKARAGVNGRVRLVESDLLAGVGGPFDLVVSNPPYVSPDEYDGLQPEIRLYEPYEAVVGVGVGESVASQASALLRPGGKLVLECGDGQAAKLAAALRDLGYSEVIETRDLAGRDRVVEGTWPR